MTSNQIAAKAELESERHNVVTEDETKRHNIAMEENSSRQNEIQAQYNSDYLALTDKINQNRMDYEYATLEEKKWYDEQYMFLQNEIHQLDDWYKTQMAMVEFDKVYETKRHNQEQENLGWYDAGIKNKQVEYQKHQWDEANYISYLNYGLERDKLLRQQNLDNFNMSNQIYLNELALRKQELAEKQYELAVKSYSLEDWKSRKNFEYAEKNYQLNEKETKAKITTGYMNAASNIIHGKHESDANAMRFVDNLIPGN